MELGLIITSVVLGIALILTILNCIKTKKKFKSELEQKSQESYKLHSDLNRFNGIVSIEKEIEHKNSELVELQKTAKFFNENINDLQTLNSELNNLKNSKEIEEKEIENKKSELAELQQTAKFFNDSIIDYKTLNAELNILKKSKELEDIRFNEIQEKCSVLNSKYKDSKTIYKKLDKEVKLFKNELEFLEIGVYEPMFDYHDSSTYKAHIGLNNSKQKLIITEERAITCDTNWTIDGSKVKGKQMTNKQKRLMLKAFNNECESLIGKVKWNNFDIIEKRIIRSFNSINNFGKPNHIHLNTEYLELKLEQLRLTHEYRLKKQEEKEKQKEERARIREEQRAQVEFEKARIEAESEERRFQKALERAKNDLGLVSGEELEKLNTQIAELQKNLQEAHEAKERAISRAQETKSGHVYIISNIGSFGENIYKIGMTRRLEPMDRVKELGDASVPFRFDLHALIFTENAPELENLLQKEFDDRRINKVNYRKEYFRVSLDEIEKVIQEKYEKEVEFIKVPEAQEYRETKSIIKQLKQAKQEQIENEIEKYPDSLF